jgi:hypothetical protein
MLFWECHTGITSETFPDGDDCWTSLEGRDRPPSLKKVLYAKRNSSFLRQNHDVFKFHEIQVYPRDIYHSWCEFRKAYTECGLTKEADILVALHGIIQEVGEAIGSRCIAGLWENRFLEDMCWRSLPGNAPFTYRRLSQWRAPSWSWASTTLPVRAGGTTIERKDYSVPRAMVNITDFLVDTKVSGELVRASLVMQCRLIPVLLHYYDPTSTRAMCLIKHSEPPLRGYEFHVHLDDPFAHQDKAAHFLELDLIILRMSGVGAGRFPYSEGLVIARCEEGVDRFKRIGSWNDDEQDITSYGSTLLGRHEAAQQRSIELV